MNWTGAGIVAVGLLLAVVFAAGCSSVERKLLFYPTHTDAANGLEPWTVGGSLIGYARTVPSPKAIWLMTHGNGGQASDRTYALPSFSPDDSVYLLEYPGYGRRDGEPGQKSFDQAAEAAYKLLRATYPQVPVCAVGESIGTGPASFLASLSQPPDKIVLIVPFDQLSLVARDHYPAFLVSLMLRDDWNNIAALSHYAGPIDIFGAESDAVIPVAHAKALAAAIPHAHFFLIPGGHNEWALGGKVRITDP